MSSNWTGLEAHTRLSALLAIDQHVAGGAAALASALHALPLRVAEGGAVDGDAGVGIAHQRHVVVLAGHLTAEFVWEHAKNDGKHLLSVRTEMSP